MLTTDFNFGDTVTVELTFNLDTGEASLTAGGETVTAQGDTGETLDSFYLRQSNSSSDETIFVDNLNIMYDDGSPHRWTRWHCDSRGGSL